MAQGACKAPDYRFQDLAEQAQRHVAEMSAEIEHWAAEIDQLQPRIDRYLDECRYEDVVALLSPIPIGAMPGATGTPISALGAMELTPKTATISRRDGLRTNQILAYLDPYTLPAPTLAQFQEKLAASGFVLPPEYEMLIGGEAENSGEAVGNLAGVGIPLMLVMAGAITLVFNSFRMMLLIVAAGVISVFYAFFGVWLFNLPFGFNAIVGSLGLFGIAINSSIVVLSLLRADAKAMADDVIAQREVVMDATRHIVATTLTTMGGFVPILITGDTFWLPLAAGIAGGVGGSALIGLYFTPAVFRIMTMKPIRRMFGYRPPVHPQPAE